MKLRTWTSLLLVLFLFAGSMAVPPPVKAEGIQDKLYVFDLQAFIDSKKSVSSKLAYDYLKLASALQGLANRDKPQLYFHFESNGIAKQSNLDIDNFWLEQLSGQDKLLSNYDQVAVDDFFELLDLLQDAADGVVLWDEDVPATANVASTIAGVENLLPIRYDDNPGSVYDEVVTQRELWPVSKNLVGMFTGSGTIPGTDGEPSTGSAKNDAYIWAKINYLDAGLTNPALMVNALDGASWGVIASKLSAKVVSAYIPTTLTPGQSADISITIENTGSSPWTLAANDRLASTSTNQFIWSNLNGGFSESINNQRVFLSTDDEIKPGDTKQFRFTIKAPDTAGTYTFSATMVRDGEAWMVGTGLSRDIAVVANEARSIPSSSDGGLLPIGDKHSGTTITAVQSINPMAISPEPYAAQLEIAALPAAMQPGTMAQVTVAYRNTGSAAWTKAANVRLGAWVAPDLSATVNEFVWSSQNGEHDPANPMGQCVYLDDNEQVAPDEVKTFTFHIIAPTQTGTYEFSAALLQEGVQWIGPNKATRTIYVTADGQPPAAPAEEQLSLPPAATNQGMNADIVSASLPIAILAGETAEVSITVTNTGDEPWSMSALDKLASLSTNSLVWKRLNGGFAESVDNQRVLLDPQELVAPGQSKTFRFAIKAPDQPGVYRFAAQMIRDGVTWSGTPLERMIVVEQQLASPEPTNVPMAATIVSAYVPQSMKLGEETELSLTFANTGTSSWTKADLYRLAAATSNQLRWTNYKDGFTNAPNDQRIYLEEGETVAPGQTRTFRFSLGSPQTAGTYEFAARMIRDGDAWFGNSWISTITVSADGTVPQIPDEVEVPSEPVFYSDLFNSSLPNADYYIARKAFFFDLSPDETSVPNDDPTQPLGSDYRTFIELLRSQNSRAGEQIITIGGFVPWFIKYTTYADPNAALDPVPAEWGYADIISKYNGQMDADAYGLIGLTNASIFRQVPLNANLKQNNDKGANGKVYDKNKKYIMFYMSDFDASAWTSGALPALWNDPKRGEIPLAWSFVPNAADRVPQVFNYLYETMKPNDYFVASDNGAGYLNPMMLEAHNRPDGLPDFLDVWEDYNARLFDRFDLDITGFLISGNSGAASLRVQQSYSTFSPLGVGNNSGFDQPIVNGTPFGKVTDLGVQFTDTQKMGDTMAKMLQRNSNFFSFRTILTKPTVIVDAVEYVKRQYPDLNFEVVDPYTYYRFLGENGGDMSDTIRTYNSVKTSQPVTIDGVADPAEWADAEEITVSKESPDVKAYGTVVRDPRSVSKYRMRWDNDNLYLLEERTDDSLHFPEIGNRMYESDATLLFFDLKRDKNGSAFRNGDYGIFMTASGPEPNPTPHMFIREGHNDGAVEKPFTDGQIASQLRSDGYTMEAAIPWSSLQVTPFAPGENLRVGMTLAATDNHGSFADEKWGQIMWVGEGDGQEYWGDMKFVTSPVSILQSTVIKLPASLQAGSTATAAVDGTYSDATVKPVTQGLVFSSSKPDVASIDSVTGLVRAIAPGQTTIKAITAASGGIEAQFTLLVYAAPAGNGPGNPPTTTPGEDDRPSANLMRQISSSELSKLAGDGGSIVIRLAAQERGVQLPIDAAELLKGQSLQVKSGTSTITLSGGTLRGLASTLTPNKSGGSMTLTLAPLTNAASQDRLKQSAELTSAQLRQRSALVELGASTIADDGTVTATTRFAEPVALMIERTATTAVSDKPVYLYKIGVDGKLTYVPSKQKDGFYTAEVTEPGSYALLEYNKSYTDVADNHWAHDVIRDLSAKQIVEGIHAAQFDPQASVTRAEFAAMLVRALGLSQTPVEDEGSIFADVAADSWYARYVAAAFSFGLINGTSATSFAPDAAITREQMVTMLMRAVELKKGNSLPVSPTASTFSDAASIQAWAIQSVNAAVELGIVKGRPSNRFEANDSATRAESAQLLYNGLSYLDNN
ncbi:S-layer homology domain-containing protein [Paenibacillus sp. MY03]|uniref:S-layer homology domain-containing protein n=1 Tax=Paenibacillus sp. MY03 TaxID=302980 RepID=UPI0015C64D30|nr:S-layer homology domain-containing protein [Paenibacillus sp. MY03]